MKTGAGSGLSQELQQRLQQRLNPQSVALGRVLEMGVPEFEEEVRRELDENPALEMSRPESADFNESSEQLQLADYADPDDAPVYLRKAFNGSADDRAVDMAALAPDEGLEPGEILMKRLADDGALTGADDARIAATIIGNLDTNGYLTRPLDDMADDIAIADGIYVDRADMERVFRAVRALEPAGIGAVDLRDCLLLQLQRLKPTVESVTATEIVKNHFALFSKMHYPRLEAALGIDRKALSAALDLIKTLNPKPASVLEDMRPSDRSQHIIPDFILDYDAASDTFTVQLNGNLPELDIAETFRTDDSTAGSRNSRSEALAFIRRKRDDARAFIKLVKMRSRTLMTIARAIVDRQRLFFISGDRADIRPMVLRDIAALTGLDISVISRSTAGKYILTPHGIYPLKMLFNERPDADSDVSTHRILRELGEIIASEDKHHPLSDRELTAILADKGYDIARRTVAKYRERLGFAVARLRKEL